jgi:chromate reductase, NAD(P)H dehydrogenase (quinone)
MTEIIALVGSLRKRSFNRALLRAAAELAPEGARLQLCGFEGFPVYDGDLEAEHGLPEVVEKLKDRIAGADGLLIGSPEYNASLPGPLKNAIDWLTRPPKDIARVFTGLPVGLVGATPGRGGTRFAQTAWLPVFRTLGMQPFFAKSLYVDSAGALFDDGLALRDEATRERVRDYMQAFVGFAGAQSRNR